jgi:hypothetical protein
MKSLHCTLVTDGSSDQALLPVIDWLVRSKLPSTPVKCEWANLRPLGTPKGLENRIRAAVYRYPCDLLFVHRDAEREPRENRVDEIKTTIKTTGMAVPFVCVVTVRMQEAWLLIDEPAIRRAAGNPHGKAMLSLPKLQAIEKIPDPKELLHEQLRIASELTGRRLRSFSAHEHAFRVAELVENWEPLRRLPAFAAFESELDEVLEAMPDE